MPPPRAAVKLAGVIIGWRRRDLERRIGFVAKVLLVAALALSNVTASPLVPGAVVLALWVLGLATFVASRIEGLVLAPSAGSVTLDERSLTVQRDSGATRTIARDAIVCALVVARNRRAVVEIDANPADGGQGEGDRAVLVMPSLEAAQSLVGELGFGARSRRRFRATTGAAWLSAVTGPALAFMGWSLGHLVAFFLGIVLAGDVPDSVIDTIVSGIVPVALMLPFYRVAKRLVRSASIEIGEDGLVLDSGLVRRTVPWADVLGFVYDERGTPTALRLADGHRAELSMASGDAERLGGMITVLMDRVEAIAAERAKQRRAPAFARDGGSIEAWRARLRSRIESSAYRHPATSLDEAHDALVDPNASREERVGAALALRIAGEPEARIRIAAEALVDEETRDALDAAAADDDAKIARILQVPRK